MLGSVLTKYWVRRMPWPVAVRIALAGIVLGNALSIVLHGRDSFMAMQFLAGFFAGSLYSQTLTILSDGENPDRDFGILIAAQVAFQAIGIWAGPPLLRISGVDAILGALVILTASGFLVAGLVPLRGRSVPARVDFLTVLRPTTLAALVGCALFLLSAGVYWTYVELIGQEAGFSVELIARSLVIGVSGGFVGALTAAWCGTRVPRMVQLAIGTLMVAVSVALLAGHVCLTAFVVSACLFNFSWNFSAAYQYALVNDVDASGHALALAPAFAGAGASIGPAVAAYFVAPHAYDSVLWLVAGGAILSFACFVVAKLIRA
jgi:predicted MFS family arabinose efflux permease